jgi:hypothetical protein
VVSGRTAIEPGRKGAVMEKEECGDGGEVGKEISGASRFGEIEIER